MLAVFYRLSEHTFRLFLSCFRLFLVIVYYLFYVANGELIIVAARLGLDTLLKETFKF